MTQVAPLPEPASVDPVMEGVRWFCPTCERILKKPPNLSRTTGNRYHSWKCQLPMVRVVVRLRAV